MLKLTSTYGLFNCCIIKKYTNYIRNRADIWKNITFASVILSIDLLYKHKRQNRKHGKFISWVFRAFVLIWVSFATPHAILPQPFVVV